MAPKEITAAERLAPWCAGVLLALPVLIVKFPPMADLPLHEASVGLLRHWGDRAFSPPGVYFVNLGHANQLFSLLAYALSWIVPIAWASKLVVAAALVALPVAAAHFADHVGASRWMALLVAPIGIGWLFFWGLIQNILGLAALLAVLPAIDTFASLPTWRGALRVCGAMLLLHFAHEAMQLVACVAIVFCSVDAPFTRRLTLLRLVPIGFCLAVVYAANWFAWHFAGPVHLGTQAFVFYELSHKLESISGVLFGGFEPYVRNLMMVLAATPVVLAIVPRLRGPRAGSVTAWFHRYRFELLALSLFVVYLVAPANIKSTTLVYHRFLPPAWAIFAVAAASGTRNVLRLVPRAICAAVPCASLLIAWPTFVDAQHIYSDLAVLTKHMARGSSVVCVDLGPDPEYRLWSPVVAMGHVVAENGGRSMYDYTQSPISVVSQRPDKQWSDVVERITGRTFMIRPRWDLTHFRYLLILTPQPTLGIAASLALRDDARPIASSGNWYLFESTHALSPIDAPDAPLPSPAPPTLSRLLKKVAKEINDADRNGTPIEVPNEVLHDVAP
jgi:hypothetical protein